VFWSQEGKRCYVFGYALEKYRWGKRCRNVFGVGNKLRNKIGVALLKTITENAGFVGYIPAS
jgi:hypothetical protein